MEGTDRFSYISEEETQPLTPIASLVLLDYMERHKLTIRDVAHASGVRLMVVWNILHNNLILPEDALRVRTGLFLLTGEHYRGSIPVRLIDRPLRNKNYSRLTQELRRV